MLPLRRLYPLVAGTGMLVASITMAVGRIGVPLDVLDRTIGRQAVLERGGATEFALVLLALSSLGLVAGMRAVRAPIAGWPERLVLVWSAALAGAAVLPAPVADVLVAAALVSLAGAAALMVRTFGDDERWKPAARPMEWLALGAGCALAVLTYVALPGHQVMIGLVEWSLLGIEVAVLVLAAVQLTRVAWTSTAPAVPAVASMASAVPAVASTATPPSAAEAPVTRSPIPAPRMPSRVPARVPVLGAGAPMPLPMAMAMMSAADNGAGGPGRPGGVFTRP
ncbi:DUF998 domain-containing protein [Sphaerisporangium corydalis]|uniref:DUF998 domain-containing protein n=1 Tax=Sphaerisporangium corydalis TaxID=1441875 RepID=A0ABV9ES96_9ACTN|nr:DUF998 domain-containing protein [Sphaerisporangium corydalis]